MGHCSTKHEINQDPTPQVVRCFLALGNEPSTISKMILSSKSTLQTVYEINLPTLQVSQSLHIPELNHKYYLFHKNKLTKSSIVND